jgi:prevent-host-death family protein
MRRVRKVGAEEARNQLPDLLKAAENGSTTIITKHGRPVAALIPIEQLDLGSSQQSILALKGTGRGFWGRNSSQTIRSLRDEWNR